MANQDKRANWLEIAQFIRSIYPYFRLSGGAILLVSVAMALMALSSMAFIHLFRFFLDNFGKSHEVRHFWAILVIFVVATAARAWSQYSLSIKTLQIRRKLEETIKHDIFKKYQEMPHEFFVKNSTGVILNRVNRETDVLCMGFDSFSLMLQDLVIIVSMFITALLLDPWLTGLALIVVPMAGYMYRGQVQAVRTFAKGMQAGSAQLNQRIIESLNGFRVIRIFQGEEREVEKFMVALRQVTSNSFEMGRQIQRVTMSSSLMKLSGGGLIIFAAGIASGRGDLTIGSMMGFVMSISTLYGPLGRIFNHYGSLQRMVGLGENVLADLRNSPVAFESGATELTDEPREMRFEDVSFRYPIEGRDHLILKEVSFSVKRGEVIAVLGPNGSGKSTLLNLIPRFYNPTSGKITLNGVELKELKLSSLRSKIATVSQDMFLFDDTIFNNILCGRPGASRAEVERASQLANAHAFIADLPHGYETRAGEKGVMLSEGQKQRIAIARAFLKDAPILLLDEPTSALDIESKSAVTTALRNLMQDRIVFLVTHQISIITPGTRIFKISGGRIIPDTSVDGVPATAGKSG